MTVCADEGDVVIVVEARVFGRQGGDDRSTDPSVTHRDVLRVFR